MMVFTKRQQILPKIFGDFGSDEIYLVGAAIAKIHQCAVHTIHAGA